MAELTLYEEGMVKITDAPCETFDYEFGDCEDYGKGHQHLVPGYDVRRDKGYNVPVVYLPHSCDSWVIGGVDQIRAMIKDLQKMLTVLEKTDEPDTM